MHHGPLPAMRLPRADLAWLALLGLILLIRFPALFWRTSPFVMDFDVFHAVAQRVVDGQAAWLYAPAGSSKAMFKYGPCWAVLLAPLGWLSSHAGAVAWAGLTVAWTLLTGWLALAICRSAGLRSRGWLFLVAIGLLVRPLTSEFLQGQTNLLWGALIAAFLYYELTGRSRASAVCLALAISLKLPAAIFLPWLAIRRQWAALAAVLGWVALLNGLAAALLLPAAPWRLFADWLGVLALSAPDRAFEIGSQSLLSLAGRLLRNDGYHLNLLALPDRQVALITLLAEAALFAGLFAASGRHPAPLRRIFDAALLTVLMVLYSPTCWIATYTALLWPATLAAAWCASHLRHLVKRPALGAAVLAALACSLMTHSKFWKAIGVRYYRGESYVYLVFLVIPGFALALAWLLWQQRRAASRG